MDYNRQLNEILHEEANHFEQLCYQVFIVNPDGKALWECIKEQHLLANKINPSDKNCEAIAMFDAGMREAFLGLYRFAQNHQAKQLVRMTNE